MKYVSNIVGDYVSITDTKDGLTKNISKKDVYIAIELGVLIVGASSTQISICSEENLTGAYLTYVISNIRLAMEDYKIVEDYELFTRLYSLCLKYYDEVKDLKVTPVIKCSKYNFIADCIARVCSKIYCDCISTNGVVSGFSPQYTVINEVYKNLGIKVYKCKSFGRKVYAVSYMN